MGSAVFDTCTSRVTVGGGAVVPAVRFTGYWGGGGGGGGGGINVNVNTVCTVHKYMYK